MPLRHSSTGLVGEANLERKTLHHRTKSCCWRYDKHTSSQNQPVFAVILCHRTHHHPKTRHLHLLEAVLGQQKPIGDAYLAENVLSFLKSLASQSVMHGHDIEH